MPEYYYLKEGDIIKEGDEVTASSNINEKPVWRKTTVAGSKAPDPRFPAHRKYRRDLSKPSEIGSGILFSLSKVNAKRSEDVFNMPVSETPLWHFGGRLAGEAGEVLQDILKIEEGRNDVSFESLAEELADVIIYCDLIASKIGISLEEAIRNKWNKVSEKKNYSERI